MRALSAGINARPSRRSFLAACSTAAIAKSAFAQSPRLQSPRLAANDRIELALIGVGVRGKYLIANLPETFRITALCDCSLDQIQSAIQPKGEFADLLMRFAQSDAKDCKVHQDYRRMLEQQRFDAVIVAAPDHHHAQAAILAMQAGCDVYIEKPLAVTITEGRAIVRAAEKYQRIVQVGSQQRTMKANRDACEFILNGGLGRIHRVDERDFPGPMPYQPHDFPEEKVPPDLKWDLFCGPTPLRPYNRHLWIKDSFKKGYLLWRGWDLFREYSGHLMTNWGAHSIDMIQFALGKDATGPTEIAVDGVPNADEINALDDQWHDKTPPLGALQNQRFDRRRFQSLKMKYADGTEIHFTPGVKSTVFHGEKGKLMLSRNNYQTEPDGLLPPISTEEKEKWSGSGHVARPHLENWLAAIQKRATVNAPPEIGHRSATVCHLANIAREIGQPLRWDAVRERFIGNELANDLLARPRRSGFELT